MLLAVDQVTKVLAERHLEVGRRVDLVGDLFGLRLYYNPGAAFSLGTSITPVLTAFASVACVVMVVALARTTRTSWALAVGLLLGGAAGNLTDRLLRPPGFARGEVVDFFQLPSFPIFNVADMGVVAGAALIVLLSFRDVPFRDPRPAPDAPAPASAGEPAPAGEPAGEPAPEVARDAPRDPS